MYCKHCSNVVLYAIVYVSIYLSTNEFLVKSFIMGGVVVRGPSEGPNFLKPNLHFVLLYALFVMPVVIIS